MIKMIQKLKNKKGFTLVELIVVIAIIAILTAVIVPLIARYSAQAQYTTLQEAASTISQAANNAMSDANQKGVVNCTEITGNKSGTTLTIEIGSYTQNTDPNQTYSDNGNERAAQKLWESLYSTLPDGASFYISVKASAVAGVVYTTDHSGNPATGVASVHEVPGFDSAYAAGSATGNAVGVSGIYVGDGVDGPAAT